MAVAVATRHPLSLLHVLVEQDYGVVRGNDRKWEC